jgi:hypothetical protein
MSGSTQAPQAPVIDVSALTTRVERASKVSLSDAAIRVPYGSATVTVGTRPVGQAVEDVLVIVDGSTRLAFPSSAVLTAILGDLIPRDVIRQVWAAADKARSS